MKSKLLQFPLLFLFPIIICLGIFFRLAYLGEKIYWVDEVSTSLRVSGYYKQEVIAELSAQPIISIADLQKYQKLSSEKNWSDTIKALKTSPEHAPLYFIIARFWREIWGNSVTAIRSLSVILSLLALPCIYWLSKELFNSYYVGILTTLLMAISPFYVAYAQEARPYSLWILTILLSNIALLKAIKNNHWLNWFFYSLSLILSFYTSLLSSFVVLGQVLYVGWEKTRIKNTLIAISFALLIFSPWLLVVINSWQRLEDNTIWMREPMELVPMIAIWLYSIAIIFVESPISLTLNKLMLTRLMVDFSLFTLIGYAFYYLLIKTKPKVYFFILFIFIIPRLVIIGLDILGNQQVSTAPRYMIPLYIGIQLTLAYLLAEKSFSPSLKNPKISKWRIIFILIISLGIISCIFNLEQSPKYQKTRNLANITIANIINKAEKQLIISEEKNILDLISLSYILEEEVKVKLLNSNFNNSLNFNQFDSLFLFNPSQNMLQNFQKLPQYNLIEIYQPQLLIPDEIHLTLWEITK